LADVGVYAGEVDVSASSVLYYAELPDLEVSASLSLSIWCPGTMHLIAAVMSSGQRSQSMVASVDHRESSVFW